jgi:hypothetical protein
MAGSDFFGVIVYVTPYEGTPPRQANDACHPSSGGELRALFSDATTTTA